MPGHWLTDQYLMPKEGDNLLSAIDVMHRYGHVLIGTGDVIVLRRRQSNTFHAVCMPQKSVLGVAPDVMMTRLWMTGKMKRKQQAHYQGQGWQLKHAPKIVMLQCAQPEPCFSILQRAFLHNWTLLVRINATPSGRQTGTPRIEPNPPLRSLGPGTYS